MSGETGKGERCNICGGDCEHRWTAPPVAGCNCRHCNQARAETTASGIIARVHADLAAEREAHAATKRALDEQRAANERLHELVADRGQARRAIGAVGGESTADAIKRALDNQQASFTVSAKHAGEREQALRTALEFYAADDTYKRPWIVKKCQSDWHATGHSSTSACPSCGGCTDERPRDIGNWGPEPIQSDRGAVARKLLDSAPPLDAAAGEVQPKEHCPRRLMGETLPPHMPCDTGDFSKDAPTAVKPKTIDTLKAALGVKAESEPQAPPVDLWPADLFGTCSVCGASMPAVECARCGADWKPPVKGQPGAAPYPSTTCPHGLNRAAVRCETCDPVATGDEPLAYGRPLSEFVKLRDFQMNKAYERETDALAQLARLQSEFNTLHASASQLRERAERAEKERDKFEDHLKLANANSKRRGEQRDSARAEGVRLQSERDAAIAERKRRYNQWDAEVREKVATLSRVIAERNFATSRLTTTTGQLVAATARVTALAGQVKEAQGALQGVVHKFVGETWTVNDQKLVRAALSPRPPADEVKP